MVLTCQFKLGIEPLCQRASEDIGRKVSLDNIVHEVFTRVPVGWVPSPSLVVGSISNYSLTFSFSQEKVIEVQSDLLASNFKDPKTATVLKEHIGHIFDGSLSHCADTLKLGLRKALNLNFVKLRCIRYGCPQGGKPVSYLSLESKTWCTYCGYSGSMVCAGCQCSRTDGCMSCRGCGKWFLYMKMV